MTRTYLAYGILFPWSTYFNSLVDSAAENLSDYEKRRLCSGWDVWDGETYDEMEEFEQAKIDSIDLEKTSEYLDRLGTHAVMSFMGGYMDKYYPELGWACPSAAIPLVVFNKTSLREIDGSNGVLDAGAEQTAELDRFLGDHITEASHYVIFWTETDD